MIRRLLLIIGAALAILIAGGSSLMSGSQLSTAINFVLPKEWKITTPEGIDSSLERISLPQFTLHYQDCLLINAGKLDVQWFEQNSIILDKAVVDYSCFAKFPESNESSSSITLDDIKPVLASLPNGFVSIKSLSWINLPEEMNSRLKGLLSSPSSSEIRFEQDILTAKLIQQALSFSAKFANNQLTAKADYQPSKDEKHQANLSANLDSDLTGLPKQFQLDYQWQLPTDLVTKDLQKGSAKMTAQKAIDNQLSGEFSAQFANNNNKAKLPFKLADKTLSLEKNQLAWEIAKGIVIKGELDGKITPNSFKMVELYPIQTAFSLDLSQSSQPKNRIKLSTEEGEIDEDYLNLPLQIVGQSKHGNFTIDSNVGVDISGEFNDIKLNVLPESLIEVTGKERFLTIKELKFPLGGVRVDKYGINGRLQASFKGESPDFKNIELNLDGFATNFKAGSNFFEKAADGTDKWQWLFWGNSQFHALKSKLLIAGSGHWQGDLIELSEFKGNLEQVKQNGIEVPKTELVITKAVKYDYRKDDLKGAMRLSAPKMKFEYGGELDKPIANLGFWGPVEHLNFDGNITAGKLGPVKLKAKRHLTANTSDFIGELEWPEQSASDFQGLIPHRQNWVITNGTAKGDTKFSWNFNKGLTSSGNVTIRNGGLSLSDTDLNGIEFSLPYRYDEKGFDLSYKKPLDLKIAEVNIGVPLTNVKVKVQGRLPATEKSPIRLRQLSLNLLGGSLDVDQFTLPQQQVAYLNLHNISFEQILELTQYRQIELRGRANATLPFWLDGNPCYICDGRIEQAGTSYLKFTPELMKAIKKAGYTEQLLAYTVNDSKVNELTATVHLEEEGNMFLDAKIRSQLVEHEKTKINLNYTHKENMFELWQLINYGSQVEQNIEHSIYQKLDKR
ncbi:hypothetical protein A1D22_07005 [Pasteurellaceae bacterium LFhippo2]|nr:hypothetical protein [Pasteurellaceae bacterium LFhippo2]